VRRRLLHLRMLFVTGFEQRELRAIRRGARRELARTA